MKKVKKAKKVIDEINEFDPNLLLDERIDKAYEQWDEWVVTDGEKFDIVSMGDWEENKDNPNILQRMFTINDVEEKIDSDEDPIIDDEPILDHIFYIKFKKDSFEIIKHYIEGVE